MKRLLSASLALAAVLTLSSCACSMCSTPVKAGDACCASGADCCKPGAACCAAPAAKPAKKS